MGQSGKGFAIPSTQPPENISDWGRCAHTVLYPKLIRQARLWGLLKSKYEPGMLERGVEDPIALQCGPCPWN